MSNESTIKTQLSATDLVIATLNFMVLAVIGTMVLAVSAKIQVPFWPIPITMQSFTVVMIGALFKTRLATATLLLYLSEGAMGLPVFAGSGLQSIGFGYLSGPTGGYLVGFVAAAAITGYLSKRGWGKTIGSAGLLFLTGLLTIEIFGDIWLASVIGIDKAVLAILPYQMASLFKIGLGMCVLPLIHSRFKVR